MSRGRLIVCVLLPFAAGYYLSYLFRTINALIAGDLTAELNLSAADLGFLTSVYFLVFAAVQLPLGALLDRYGPRTIQSALLLLASAGALVFALADGLLRLGDRPRADGSRRRLGLDGRLQGHRAVVPARAPRARQRLARHAGRARRRDGDRAGRVGRAGVGWRGLFAVLAGLSALAALLVLFAVPEPSRSRPPSKARSTEPLGRLPGSTLLAHCAALGSRHRHVLVAAGPVGRAVAARCRRPRSCGRRPAPERDGGRCLRQRPASGHGRGPASSSRPQDRARVGIAPWACPWQPRRHWCSDGRSPRFCFGR